MKNLRLKSYLIRYVVLTISLFVMAFGVALSTKAGLGTSPISCVPYTLSLLLPWSMGAITIAMHVIFILLQIAILRKNYQWLQLLQLPVAFIFGIFTDITMFMVKDLHPETYPAQFALCILSCVIVGLGVYMEVTANVIMLAGEGLISAFTQVLHGEFGRFKVFFDTTLVIIGTAIALVGLHQLVGVREGTIVAAFLVGNFVRFFSRHLAFLARLCAPFKEAEEEVEVKPESELESSHSEA